MKTTITSTTGQPIVTLSDFYRIAVNTGQQTQGSDCHEALIIVNGQCVFARKHWSNDCIGLSKKADLTGGVGTLFFEDLNVKETFTPRGEQREVTANVRHDKLVFRAGV